MEITTTIVKFFFPKGRMEVHSEDAQMFLCPKDEGEDVKVWVPYKKLHIREYDKNPNFNVCYIPKWVFFKTALPTYISGRKEFVVTSKITEAELTRHNS